jgi:hypothetical protein
MLLGVLLLVLGLAATLSPIRNYDYWWHLRTGALILEQGAVPRADPFSFTAAGVPWADHEWLFQVLTFLVHTWAGPQALVILKAALVFGLCLLMFHHLERERHGPAGIAVFLTLALVGAAFRIDVRPELATLLILPLAIDLAIRGRERRSGWTLAAIVLLTGLGANLHVGIVLLPAMLAAATAWSFAAALLGAGSGGSGTRRLPGAWQTARPLAIVTLGSALAVGANPYGFRLYAVPFELQRLLAGLPWPNLEWVRPTFETVPLFFVVLAGGLVVTLLGLRHADPIGTSAWIVSAVLAVLHVRNVGLFFLLMPWGLARPARALVEAAKRTRLYTRTTRGEAIRPGFIVAVVLLLGGLPLLLALPPRPTFGLGIASDNEPDAAASFLESESVGDHLYNDVRFGGYLIWRRYPAGRVFIDGRNELYGDLMRDIAGAMAAPEAWRAFLDRHAIDAAFLRYPPTLQKIVFTGKDGRPRTGERAFSAAYFPIADWALVYWDDDAMIFVRRTPEHADLISRREYTALNPDDWRYIYAGVMIGRLSPAPILQDLQRKLEEDPDCRRALDLMGRFAAFAAPADAARDAGGTGR